MVDHNDSRQTCHGPPGGATQGPGGTLWLATAPPCCFPERAAYCGGAGRSAGGSGALAARAAGTVKITLVGRPGPVQQTARPDQPAEFVAFPMESGKLPSLPKGLPSPTVPTKFLVLVSGRQWRRVADVLRNPQDRLIIEGHSSIDARVQDMITVRAISVTTVEAQRALRAKQQTEAEAREGGQVEG